MKRFACILTLVLFVSNTGFGQVNFETLSLQQALEKAGSEGKKVFIDVYTTWCGPCKRMDAYVFSDKAIGDRMSGEYIALKIDHERSPHRRDVSKYLIRGYPTMLILDSKGMEIGRIFGARTPEAFNLELDKYSRQKSHPISKAIQDMTNNPDDPVVWKRSLGILDNNINLVYRHNLSRAYTDACEDYYKRFDIRSIEDDVDRSIFRNVTLPLEHPVVQHYLKDPADFGSYLHKKYMTMAFKNEVKKAKTEDEIAEIKIRVGEYYDLIFEGMNGDVEPKAYFVEEIFSKVEGDEEK